jgi:hypothetical protein
MAICNRRILHEFDNLVQKGRVNWFEKVSDSALLLCPAFSESVLTTGRVFRGLMAV